MTATGANPLAIRPGALPPRGALYNVERPGGNATASDKAIEMIIQLPQIVPRETVASIRSALAGETFVDGRETAENEAALVKNNLQLPNQSPLRRQLSEQITEIVMGDQIFTNAVMPKRLSGFHFSRYEPGMAYGEHMDNVFMSLGTQQPLRADVSMTLFLDDPTTYDGGELIITSNTTPQPVKMLPGDAVVYPTTDFHRVAPVTRGARRAAVCWIQSMVRSAARREIITEMWMALDYMYKLQPPDQLDKNEAFRTLAKARFNLIRMWAEA